MTDAIVTAQQISKCEQETTQEFIHSWQLYNNADFEEYRLCVGNNTTYATGGYNNPTAQALCRPILERNRKTYCANKARNQPPPVQPVTPITGSSDVPISRDEELLARQKEAAAQKLVAERQAQMLELKNKAVTDSRNTLINSISNAAISILPKPPIVDSKVLAAVALANQIKNLARERRANSKSALSKGKKVYTYPITPMTPESSTLSVSAEQPKPPTIPQLPIA